MDEIAIAWFDSMSCRKNIAIGVDHDSAESAESSFARLGNRYRRRERFFDRSLQALFQGSTWISSEDTVSAARIKHRIEVKRMFIGLFT